MADLNLDAIDRIARIEEQLTRRPNEALRERLDEYKTQVAHDAAVAQLAETHATELETIKTQKVEELATAVQSTVASDATEAAQLTPDTPA